MTRDRSGLSRRSVLAGAGAASALAFAPHLGHSAKAVSRLQGSEPVAGGTLIYGNSAPAANIISPLNTIGTGQNVLIEALFLRLMYGRKWGDGINPDPSQTEFELAVAESVVEIEPDRVWEFTLRDNVFWHDGQPVTVDDVIFGIWLSLNSNSGAANETPVVGIKGGAKLREEGAAVGDISVEGATKIGDRGLRIELENPIPNYWVNWSVGYWPYPKHIFGETPFEELFNPPYSTMPIGNGPFKAVQFVEGQYMEMEANPDFFAGKPLLDKFIVRFGDTDTLTAALEAGEIHGMSASAGPIYDRLTSLDNLVGNPVPRDHPDGFSVNRERWPDHGAALTKATMYAIDVASINESLASGTLRPSNYLFGHVVGLETPPEGFPTYSYDPDAARAVLAEAGWDSNTELEWMVWSPPSATYDAMAAMLSDVGIKTAFKQIDVATIYDEMYIEKNYDITYGNFGAAQSMLDNWRYIKCGWGYETGGWNATGYCNEEVDALWQQALDETDWDAAVPIWNETSLALGADPPQGTLSRGSVSYVWSEKVQGAYPYQYRLPVRNAFERVWLTPDE
jgi:peptide/nickel transport system substrate-binding protein